MFKDGTYVAYDDPNAKQIVLPPDSLMTVGEVVKRTREALEKALEEPED